MRTRPYRWQQEAFVLFRDVKAFMLNVCCGAGKTFAGIWIATHKALPVIVIAPKTLCSQWKDELMYEGIKEDDIFVFDQPTYSKNPKQYREAFSQWLQS